MEVLVGLATQKTTRQQPNELRISNTSKLAYNTKKNTKLIQN
jgi:hypothetical protein